VKVHNIFKVSKLPNCSLPYERVSRTGTQKPPPPLQDPPLSRYDYEKVDAAAADKMVERLNAFIADKTSIGKEFTAAGKTFKVAKAEDFEYVDPIDKSVAKKQVETSLLALCG